MFPNELVQWCTQSFAILILSLICLVIMCLGSISFIEWLVLTSSPRKPFFNWLMDIKTYDSGYKVGFAMVALALGLLPYFIARAIYGMFYELFSAILSCPFNWEFSHYLEGDERVKYTTWWRDCTEGGWRLFVGPFGITRIVKSVCK